MGANGEGEKGKELRGATDTALQPRAHCRAQARGGGIQVWLAFLQLRGAKRFSKHSGRVGQAAAEPSVQAGSQHRGAAMAVW